MALAIFSSAFFDGLHEAPTWHFYDRQTARLWYALVFLMFALTSTRANRGRVIRKLGELLNARGSAVQEAASVAALLGDRGAAKTLRTAARCFLALPLADLTREELVNNKPDPTLNRKTVVATLGEVDAFASHSWSDDGTSKFDKLHEWAAGEPRLVWLDKACIDQLDIDTSLACLPVYLAGCRQLLVLAGS